MKKQNNLNRLDLTKLMFILLFSFGCIVCFFYYTVKFCNIIVLNKETITWGIFGIFILVSIILGIINFIKLTRLEKKNFQLKELIVELGSESDSHYYSILEHIQNSRDISLDVLDELREKL